MNNETENWKLNKIDVWINCVRSRECRICRFRESNFQFFFPGEHAPEPPYIIRAFGADSTPALVSAVTLVLNVQLQKNSIPGQNEYWETVVQNLHNSGWKQKFEHQRNYTKQDQSCSKTGNKIRATCFATLLQTKLNSDVAHFATHVRPCLARNKVARFVFVGGKTSNITIPVILQLCCKTNCALFVASFTVP